MISYLSDKIKFLYFLYIYIFISLDPLLANGSRDYVLISELANRCYRDIEFCNEALLKINNYQKNASINKKFTCQTRLLGLEANLIMAKNANFKRKEVKSIIDAIKKYC